MKAVAIFALLAVGVASAAQVGPFGQCGDSKGLFQNVTCPAGYACVDMSGDPKSPFYQCRNDQVVNATSANTTATNVASAGAPANSSNPSSSPSPSPSPATGAGASPSPSPSPSPSDAVGAYTQCGTTAPFDGEYTGQACPSGYRCVKVSVGYYQCRNDQLARGSVSPSPSPSTATLAEAAVTASPSPSPRPSPSPSSSAAAAALTLPTATPANVSTGAEANATATAANTTAGTNDTAAATGASTVNATTANATTVPGVAVANATAAPANASTAPVAGANGTFTVERAYYNSPAAFVAATPDLSQLLSLANSSGLVPTLSNGSFVGTVFAPNNYAVAQALKFAAGKTLTKQQQTTLLTYHVVPGASLSADRIAQQLAASNGTLQLATLEGSKILVSNTPPAAAATTNESVLAQEAGALRRLFQAESATVIYLNNATKVLAGAQTGQSYTHVIDRVLVPPTLYSAFDEQAVVNAPTNDTAPALAEKPVQLSLDKLTPEEIAALAPADLAAVDSTTLGLLSDAQKAALTDEQRAALSPEQLAAIGEPQASPSPSPAASSSESSKAKAFAGVLGMAVPAVLLALF